MRSNTPETQTNDQSHEPSDPTPRRAARVTVNLNAKSTQALDETVALTGDTQTDVINRALQVYAYLEAVTAEGTRLYLEHPDGKERERLRFF